MYFIQLTLSKSGKYKLLTFTIFLLTFFTGVNAAFAGNHNFFSAFENAPPTIDPIPDPNPISVNSGPQTIVLSGITDGGLGEKQEVFVTATSNNTSLIPNPQVSYLSPDATGTLSYTPVANASGSAVITVSVSDGESSVTENFTVVVNPPLPPSPPPAPVAIAASGIGQNNFTARWNAVAGADSYRLDVSAAANFSSFVSGLENKTINGTSETVSGLTPNTQYYYRVRAVNAGGPSGNSNVINVTTQQISPPPAPVAIAASGVGQNNFTARWNAVAGADSYRLDVSAAANFSSFVSGFENKIINGTSESVSGLTPNTQYYYRVRAVNAGGPSGNSNVINVQLLQNQRPTLDPINDEIVTTKNPKTHVINLTNITPGPGEDQPLTVTGRSDNPAVIPDPIINYNYPSTTGQLRIKPNKNVKGTARISVTVDDGQAVNNSITRTFAVNAVTANAPPTSQDKTINIDKNQVYNFQASDFSFSDPDEGDTFIELEITSLPTAGTLKLNNTNVSAGQKIIVANIPNLNFTPANNAIGSPYATFQFKVSDGVDFSTNSNIITINVNDVIETPAAPIATAATSVTQTGFTANWNAVAGATNYFIDVSTAENFSSFVSGYNNKTVEGTSEAVTGLSPNTIYYFRVRAANSAGTSGSSNVINVTTQQVSAPAAPVATSASGVTQTAFTANWNAVDGATGYQLDISTANNFSSFLSGYENKTVNGTTEAVSGLTAGTTYYYRVRAVNAGGASGNSNVITATTSQVSAPAAPVATAATGVTQTAFTANWNAVDGATGYQLDISTANNFSSFLSGYENKTVNGTSEAVSGLTAGTTYYYRVRAVNAGGASGNSNVITTTTSQVNAPAAPVATAATGVTQSTFIANWNAVAGADNYRLDISTSSNFSTFLVGYENKTINGTTEAVSGLMAGTSYYYRIRAVNAGGTSGNSNIITATTVAAINTAPTLNAIADPAPINEGAGQQTINLSGITAGAEQDQTLTVTATSNNTALIPNPTVNYTSPQTTGTLTYTPVTNQSGTAVITVTVTDSGPATPPNVNSVSRTFTVVVNAVNSPPTLNAISDPAPILEDSDLQTVAISGITAGPNESQNLTVTAVSSNPALIPNPEVNYTSPNTTGTLTYTPVANASGTATITVTVNDGAETNNTISRTFIVRVLPVNDPPLFTISGDVTVEENFSTIEKVTVTPLPVPEDEKNQIVTYSLTPSSVNFANVVINPATGEVTITAKPFQSGGQQFTITANDGQSENNIATQTFILTVGSVNKAPVFTVEPEAIVVNEDFTTTETVVVTPGTVPANESGQVVSYTISPNSVDFADVTINSSTGLVTIKSLPDRFGTQTFTITADDGQSVNNIATQTFDLTVNPINDPPTLDAISDPAPIPQNASQQTINLTGITAGPFENQTLTIIATSNNKDLIPDPVIEYSSPQTSGLLTYTPVQGESGTAEITVTIVDSGNGTPPHQNTFSRSFTVSVISVNMPPTLDPIADPAAINEDADLQTIILTGISAGPGENQALTITAVSDNKSLIPDPQVIYTSPENVGTLQYKPVANRSGTATITVTVTDDGPGDPPNVNSVSRTFTIQVNEINDAPTLALIPDPVAIPPDSGPQIIELSGISAGPEENQVLTITAISNNPGLIPNPTVNYTSPGTTGTLEYTPVAGQLGVAVITVTVTDDGPGTFPHVNTISRTFTVRVYNEADLVITEATVGRSTLAAGESLLVTATLRNLGSISVAESKLKYYLSNDNSYNEDLDVELGTDDIAALTSGQSANVTNTLTIPVETPPGEYFILFYADAENVLNEFDEDNNTFVVAIIIGDEYANLIEETIFPEYFTVGSSEIIGITTTGNVSRVQLNYRGISETTWKQEEIAPSQNSYQIPAPVTDKFDEIGVEYFFEVFSENNQSQSSATAYTYLRYAGNGLNIPDLKNGATVQDYQIISIPLELTNKTIAATIEDDLGNYNKTQWRFFHYANGSSIEFKEGVSNIDPGKGYWLISRHARTVDTGEGTTFKVTKENPYTVRLLPGWNQIGNPYNFNLSWNEILNANGSPDGIGNLKVYTDQLVESDVLPKFRGGFVFSENETDLIIPVIRDLAINNGRLAKSTGDENEWEVFFKVKSSGLQYQAGGFGMNENADFSKDKFDDIALPQFNFLNNVSIIFDHPEYFYPDFARDIIPKVENYTWEFSVISANDGEDMTLDWEMLKFDEENNLVLIDLDNQQKVNMNEKSSYSFKINRKKSFKVLYGSAQYIEEQLLPSYIKLGSVYPNPFENEVFIPFEVPVSDKKVKIHLKVYDSMGKTIVSFPEKEYGQGLHNITWNGENGAGKRCSAGMYIFKIVVDSEKGLKEIPGRIILK